jgi:Protein of unknown function (DUF5131)
MDRRDLESVRGLLRGLARLHQLLCHAAGVALGAQPGHAAVPRHGTPRERSLSLDRPSEPRGAQAVRSVALAFAAHGFVNSMSDLFHESVPDAWIVRLFAVMRQAPQHAYQVLTKRPERVAPFLARTEAAIPDCCWLGVSVERQDYANRVDALRAISAPVRALSCEPLLGPLDLELSGIDWVIVGGESGPRRRMMNPEWARSLRDQCAAAGVAFFMKQMTGKAPIPLDLLVRQWP